MNDTTESNMDAVIDMIANPKAEAPERTESQSQTSETDDYEPDDADGATDGEYDAEAESDDTDAGDVEDNPDADEAEDDAPDEPQTFTVVVDGKERAVTLDELRRGYSGQAKIQQDLQANAEVRKQLEQAAQYLVSQQEQLLQLHQRAQERGFKAPPQAPDRRLLDTNPTEYMRARAAYEDKMGEYQQEQAQIAQMHQQQIAFQRQQQAQRIAQNFEILKERMPEFADQKAAPEFARKLMKAGTDYGFSSDELGGIDDPRALEVLRDAMNWRNLKAKQQQAGKPPQPTRNLQAKAAVKRTPDVAEKARRKMRQSGSVDDVAAFLLSK